MNKNTAIAEKLEIAKSWLNEVDVHIGHGFYATAVSRLYYGCFYATQGLLLTKDLFPKTHKGTVKMLHLHFVKTGVFDKAKSDFYSDVLNERMVSDYDNPLRVTKAIVEKLMDPAKEYVAYVINLVEAYLNHTTENTEAPG